MANMIGLILPWCPGAQSGDVNQIIKSLVAVSKMGVANSSIAEGGIEQHDAESSLAKAVRIIQTQPSPGLTALSKEELDEFLARLDASKPTTMLTVTTSMPTKRATPEVASETEHSPEEELKKTAVQTGEICVGFPPVLFCF